MHELGLAEGILDIVREHVPAGRESEVTSIEVRVGTFAGVDPESLAFCFAAITADTPLRAARLAIERRAGRELQVVAVELGEAAGGVA